MARAKYIKCDIYKRGIHIVIGTHNQLLKYAKKEYKGYTEDYKEFLEGIQEKTGGYATTYFGNGECIILLPKFPEDPKNIGVLTHELLHAVDYILWYSGVKRNPDNVCHEEYNYLLEYLTKEALKKEDYEVFK